MQVWVDTSGHAAPYPILRFAGASVVAYVHYPTISTDMLSRVRQRTSSYNNASFISSSLPFSILKFLYYNLFSLLYGFLGGFATVVIVNSTWTRGHVSRIWWGSSRRPPAVVYPPCDVSRFASLPLQRPLKLHCLCSIAQFRPEKNHRFAAPICSSSF
jgi:alpha-1,2-mannosyltransferase